MGKMEWGSEGIGDGVMEGIELNRGREGVGREGLEDRGMGLVYVVDEELVVWGGDMEGVGLDGVDVE